MTADLSALIARLEAGPVYLTHKEAYDLAIFFGSDEALGMASMIRKAFAGGSLDAALGLAERVLPGCCPGVARNVHHKDWYSWVGSKDEEGCGDLGNGRASTPALALCIAVLRAKAQEG